MNTADPVQVVRDLYDAFAARNLSQVFAKLAPDVEFQQSKELPWGGDYKGHDGARQFFANLGAHVTPTLTIERYISADDHVVAIGSTRGTVNATGAAFDVPVAHVWTIRKGLATRARFFIHHPAMLPALNRRRL